MEIEKIVIFPQFFSVFVFILCFSQLFPFFRMTSVGVPIKILHEAEGHVVTLETVTGTQIFVSHRKISNLLNFPGEIYRGKLIEAEDNMNCQLSETIVTFRDGRSHQLENVFIRGNKIRFMILPDMLKNAPMFKNIGRAQKGAIGMGLGGLDQRGRGRGTAFRRPTGRGGPRGMPRGGGGAPPFRG